MPGRLCWLPAVQGLHSHLKPYDRTLPSFCSGLPLANGINVLLLLLIVPKGKHVRDVDHPLLPCCTHLAPPGIMLMGIADKAGPLLQQLGAV